MASRFKKPEVTKYGLFDLVRAFFQGSTKGIKGHQIKKPRPGTPEERDIRKFLGSLSTAVRREDRKIARDLEKALGKPGQSSGRGGAPPTPPISPGTPPAPGGGGGAQGIANAIAYQRVTSSNVWAIGYDHQTGTLGVIYKAWRPGQKGKSDAQGPTYHYYDVPPRKWKSFESASSKGKWIWDNMRIRHTISGHRYEYRLIFGSLFTNKRTGKPDAYIPRLATGKGFEKRRRIYLGNEKRSKLKKRSFNEGKAKKFFLGR